MARVQLTRDLLVSSSVEGKIVSYKIFQSKKHTETCKTTRYSELAVFDKEIKREVQGFKAELPPKTLRHQTNDEFVKTRRDGIETYLQQAVVNASVTGSQAWIKFLSDAVAREPPAGTSSAASASAAGAGESSGVSALKGMFEGAKDAVKGVVNIGGKKDADHDKSAVSETQHESEEEEFDLEGSVYDKLRTQLQKKQSALAEAKGMQSELNSKLQAGQSSIATKDEEAEVALAFRSESRNKLSTHRYSLQELERELNSLKQKKSDTESSKTSEIASLEEGLKAAAEATRTGKEKFEGARTKLSTAEAEGKNKIVDSDGKVQAALIKRTAGEEHFNSMNAAFLVMSDRLQQREKEAKKLAIEREVANKAKVQVESELNTVKDDVRTWTNKQRNTAAALASHIESSARRARAFEAEVRRATECANHANQLRDKRTRGELMGEDRKGLENAEQLANKGAESAGKGLEKTKKKADESLKNDKEKLVQLKSDDEQAMASLKRYEVVLRSMQTHLTEVDTKLKYASERLACAKEAQNVAMKDNKAHKERVEGELTKNRNDADKQWKEAKDAAAAVRKQVDDDLIPLKHKEEAERVVFEQAEQAEKSLIQLLDEARTVLQEAKAIQYEAKPEDIGKIEQGDRRSVLIEGAKQRVADSSATLKRATAAAKEAQKATNEAQEDLKKKEQDTKEELERFRAEVEEAYRQEMEGEGFSEEELAEFAAAEEDAGGSEELKKLKEESTLAKAVADDLALVNEEQQSALSAATAADEAAHAELTQLEEEEKKAEMPPLTAYYVNQELQTVQESMKIHEDAQTVLMEAEKKRKEDWDREKTRLQEELHQAGISIDVAKDDLAAAKNIKNSLQK